MLEKSFSLSEIAEKFGVEHQGFRDACTILTTYAPEGHKVNEVVIEIPEGVERIEDIPNLPAVLGPAFARGLLFWYKFLYWAHGIGVTRVQGMDESRVRFPVGPPNLICRRTDRARGGAARMDGHFRKEMPRLSEFPRQNSRRYAAVRADVHQKIFHPRKIFCLNEIFGLVGLNNPISHEFEPMIAFPFKITQFLFQRSFFRRQRILTLQILAKFQCFI